MPSDMRRRLVTLVARATGPACNFEVIEEVVDSIPPGSFKRDDGTWVKLERDVGHVVDCPWPGGPCSVVACDVRYTEVDHAE